MLGLAAGLLLAGCGGNDLVRLQDTVAPRDLNVFQRRGPLTARFTPPEEMVGPDGRCASEPAPASAPTTGMDLPASVLAFSAGPRVQNQQPPVPPSPADAQPGQAGAPQSGAPQARGIALDMTECDVVRIAGVTDRVEIAANERNQRSLVLTYLNGPRPGIYRFLGGRLVSIERGPEPPAPAKPAKSKKKPKQAAG